MDGGGSTKSSEEKEAERLMDGYLKTQGLHRKKIAKDGSCLFRAVAEQVLHNQGRHTEVRAKCVEFLKENRGSYEAFIEGDFEDYLFKLQDPQQWVGEVEINALAVIYKRDFFIFQEPGKPAVNITDNNFRDKVQLCFLNGNHYDSVYAVSRIQAAALCQSILYELLYGGVFGVERGALGSCQRSSRPADLLSDDAMSACVSSDDSDLEAGEPLWVEKEANAPARPNNQRGRGRGRLLPERVRRSLNPTLLRNVEYDVWHKSKRAQQKMDYCIAAGMQFTVGDRCQVRLEGRSHGALVKEVSPNNGPVSVYLKELGTIERVPLWSLRPPSEENSWSTVVNRGEKKLSNGPGEWEERRRGRGKNIAAASSSSVSPGTAPGASGRVQKQHSWPPQATVEEQGRATGFRKSLSAVDPHFGLTERQRSAKEVEEKNLALVEIQLRDENSFPALGGDGGRRKGGDKRWSSTTTPRSPVDGVGAPSPAAPPHSALSAAPPHSALPAAPPHSALSAAPPHPAPPAAPPHPAPPAPPHSALPAAAPPAAPSIKPPSASGAVAPSPPPSATLFRPAASPLTSSSPTTPPCSSSPPTFIAPIAPSPTAALGFLPRSPPPLSSFLRSPSPASFSSPLVQQAPPPHSKEPSYFNASCDVPRDIITLLSADSTAHPPDDPPSLPADTGTSRCIAKPPGPPTHRCSTSPSPPIQLTEPASPPPPRLQVVPLCSSILPTRLSSTKHSPPPPPPHHQSIPGALPLQQLSQLYQDPLYPGFPQGEGGRVAPTPLFCSSRSGNDLPRDLNILKFFFNLGIKAYTMPMFPPYIYLLPLQQAHTLHPKLPSPTGSPTPHYPPSSHQEAYPQYDPPAPLPEPPHTGEPHFSQAAYPFAQHQAHRMPSPSWQQPQMAPHQTGYPNPGSSYPAAPPMSQGYQRPQGQPMYPPYPPSSMGYQSPLAPEELPGSQVPMEQRQPANGEGIPGRGAGPPSAANVANANSRAGFSLKKPGDSLTRTVLLVDPPFNNTPIITLVSKPDIKDVSMATTSPRSSPGSPSPYEQSVSVDNRRPRGYQRPHHSANAFVQLGPPEPGQVGHMSTASVSCSTEDQWEETGFRPTTVNHRGSRKNPRAARGRGGSRRRHEGVDSHYVHSSPSHRGRGY
ncbi:LOW QUALITY PROTEIN: OTU domain-containing protein 4 [Spinachia spinachia]